MVGRLKLVAFIAKTRGVFVDLLQVHVESAFPTRETDDITRLDTRFSESFQNVASKFWCKILFSSEFAVV